MDTLLGLTTPADQVAPAAAVQPVDDDRGGDAIVARVGAGRFAVALDSVAEVGRAPRVTRVPGLPSWMSGVANWRGRILPVLVLHEELGEALPTSRAAGGRSSARLLVLSTGGLTVGLLVDAVEGTAQLAGVESLPATLPDRTETLLCGQVPDPSGPVAVLDVAQVMALRQRLPQGRRSA